jgi:endonuclease I
MFKTNQQLLPFIYAPASKYSQASSNLEHIVPRSILIRNGLPEAVNDPHNIHISMGPVNQARSNFPFSFAQCLLREDDLSLLLRDSTHVGFSNFVDRRKRVFYPRKDDCALIARTLLKMQDRWEVPLENVAVASLGELVYVASSSPPTIAEIRHWEISNEITQVQQHNSQS